MSPAKKRPRPKGATVIETGGGKRKYTIDGKPFEVNFDDAKKMRLFLGFRDDVLAVLAPVAESDDIALVTAALESVAVQLRESVDLILGEGTYAMLFDGEDAVFRGMALMKALEADIAPAYDALLASYAVN